MILCEGPHDAAFFRELIRDRLLPEANVTCPSDNNRSYGKSGFPGTLHGFPNLHGFFAVKDIVLVADCDADPQASFAEVVAGISGIGTFLIPALGYPIPTKPLERTIGAGVPALTILMVPWFDRRGALDTLCCEAALRGKTTEVDCIDNFARCIGADAWAEPKKSQMRLRSFLSGTYQNNPNIGFGNIWRDEPKLVPVSDSAFNQIADFLRNL